MDILTDIRGLGVDRKGNYGGEGAGIALVRV